MRKEIRIEIIELLKEKIDNFYPFFADNPDTKPVNVTIGELNNDNGIRFTKSISHIIFSNSDCNNFHHSTK